MATLAEIRAKLEAQSNTASNSGGDKSIYPHWNMKEGESCHLRFLPDGDPDNTFFWVERAMIKLPFAGIAGQPNSKPVTVQVPCMEMWEPVGSCPILSEVRTWFKDPSLEDVARKYWKKRSYLLQGFVRKDPLGEDAPEKLIRRFIISPQIYAIIKSALMDPELEEMPTDYHRGLDFQIIKTTKGGWADYSTSKWSRKESPLTPEEQAEIDTDGLLDLKSFLPKKPDAAHLAAIKEMFEASVDGQPYDPVRWGQFYKPPGFEFDAPTTPVAETPESRKPIPEVQTASPEVKEKVDLPFDIDDSEEEVEAEPEVTHNDSSSGSRAQEILAMIRSRSQA